MKAYVVPAVSFALAVALSFVAGRGYSGVTRAQSSGTKTCVADAKVTAMTVTVKQYHFKLATQPIDASCLPEGFTVNVNDILTFSAESVVARDFDNKKHTVAGPVNFTVVFEKPWKHHFASGVYLNVETAPMQVTRHGLDQALQTTVVNLLAAQNIKIRKIEAVVYPAQTANIQARGSVKCDSGGDGTFTGKEVGLAVTAAGN